MRIDKEQQCPRTSSLRLVESVTKLISRDASDLPGWYRDYADAHRSRIAFDLDLVRDHVRKDARVLEVGSVPFLLTCALQDLGYDLYGVDIAPERFQAVIPLMTSTISKCDIETESLPFPDASFDAILFFELFEHLRINPIFTMREVFRVMKPSAVILLSTPNLKSLDGIINFLFRGMASSVCGDIYKEFEKLQVIGHMGHVREYTRNEVVDFLTKSGFTVTQIIYRGWYPNKCKRLVLRLFSQLRPYVTIVATKQEYEHGKYPLP